MPVERASGGTSLIDVLDRVLDKGIVIDAWVRVSLVGIDAEGLGLVGGHRHERVNEPPGIAHARRAAAVVGIAGFLLPATSAATAARIAFVLTTSLAEIVSKITKLK